MVAQGSGQPLTARQAEFLEAVQSLARGGEAVHYSQVADRLGVSRWTAYDILSSLARRGYLHVEREQRPGTSLAGRCRVLFRPAGSAVPARGGAAPAAGAELGDWWEDRLHHLQREIRERGVWPVLHELLADLARVSRPAVFCSTLTLALVVALRGVARGAEATGVLSSLLGWLAGGETGLAVFASAVAGLLLQHGMPRDVHKQLVERLPAFEQEVSALDRQGRETLRCFTLNAIREFLGADLSADPAS